MFIRFLLEHVFKIVLIFYTPEVVMISTLIDGAQRQMAMPLTDSNIFHFHSLSFAKAGIVIFSNG